MKKSVVAVALAGALGVAAHAATVSEFANGVLVPRVIDGGSGDSTAIGLTSCANGTVFWTFFDPDTKHVLDDRFNVTADDQVNLVWNQTNNPGTDRIFGGQGVEGELGYLVFVLDTNGDDALSATVTSSDVPCLAGNAFQVDLGSSDVAFVPALPLDLRPIGAGDFNDAPGPNAIDNLALLDETSITGLNAGANANDDIYLRYFIADANDNTDIHIWSAQDISGEYTVFMYDNDQNFRSVNLALPREELNTVDPRPIIGRPQNYVDGFIKWNVPDCSGSQVGGTTGLGNPKCPGSTLDLVRGVFSWSVIDSPAFGAVQTVINPIKLFDRAGNQGFRVRVIEDDNGSVDDHSLEGL